MTQYTALQTDYIVRREAALRRLTLLTEHITTVKATEYKSKHERDVMLMGHLNEELHSICRFLGLESQDTPLFP